MEGGLTMAALAFVLGMAGLFFALLAYETSGDATQARLNPPGLLTWLASGNWPAKVGAALLIVGIGALIRYLLLALQVPPEVKTGTGVAAAALLAVLSFRIRQRPDRRALHFALAGTALGVAYLTAYSAYGFFGYVNSATALALLILVVAAGGTFALKSGALSIAVLSMFGAYLAPAFTIGNPGPSVVYGYYVGASLFTFVLVYFKGWRALIHLSFLFTLAGALFFGWTRAFYTPQHYTIMNPLLLALAAIHLAMPIVERRAIRAGWMRHVDTGYALALPAVAAVLMLLIAPDIHSDGALGLVMLAVLWALAAGVIWRMGLEDGFLHAIVAGLLVFGAGFLYLEDLPWSLLALWAATLLFVLAPRLAWSRDGELRLAGIVLLLGVIHIQQSLLSPPVGEPFASLAFVQRLLGVAALALTGIAGRRRRVALGDVLAVVAGVWGGLVVIAEFARLHIETLPQLIYALELALVVGIALSPLCKRLAVEWMALLAVLAGVTAFWSAHDAPEGVAWILAPFTLLALFFMAFQAHRMRDQRDAVPAIFALAAPLAFAPWAWRVGWLTVGNVPYFPMTAIVLSAAMAAGIGGLFRWRMALWGGALWIYFWCVGLLAMGLTIFHIERGPWPVALDLASIATLVLMTGSLTGRRRETAGTVSLIVGVFVVQAMLLRALGPAGVLNVTDLSRMAMPALVSLMWALLGGGMCGWATRIVSRNLWCAGALLLVLSAIKLILFDFGSLGQLSNIIAILLAGLVFLAVAWLAPIPPRTSKISAPEMHATSESGAAGASRSAMQSGQPADSDASSVSTAASRAAADAAMAPDVAGSAEPDATAPATARRRRYEPEIPAHWLVKEEPSLVKPLLIGLGALGILAWGWSHYRDTWHPKPVHAVVAAPPIVEATGEEPAPIHAPAPVPPRVETPPRVVNDCSRFIDHLPADYALVAGGEYAGRKLGFQIDQSGHEATGFDVSVNMPGQKVVLVLGAYEPSVWKISRDARTQIMGVFVTGYYRQDLIGLDARTPVLNSSRAEKGSCGYSYLSGRAADMDKHVRQVLGRSAQMYVFASNGRLNFGEEGASRSLVQDSPADFQQLRRTDIPPAGREGLDKLVSEGVLRPARPEDFLAWKDALRRAQGLPPLNVLGGTPEQMIFGRSGAYVVQGPMTFPAGLHGANLAAFIVLKGVPRPAGNPGHSAVYDWNTMTCEGAICR